jgi:hypothetical protein
MCGPVVSNDNLRSSEAIWWDQVHLAMQEIMTLIPSRDAYILVDQQRFGDVVADGRHTIPFLERNGQYQGTPPDDATAIRELERLRRSGARFMVFGWPAFWWLNHYSELHRHLCSKFRCVLENERLVAFDLRP